jgi:cellulose synthase (UDP-forming)
VSPKRKKQFYRPASIKRESPTLMLVVLVAAIGALLYANFLLNPSNRGDVLPYVLVVIAECFIIFHAIVALWTILAGGYNPRGFEFHAAQEGIFAAGNRKYRYDEVIADRATRPDSWKMYLHNRQLHVDVFITVYGEPIETIKETVIAARDMTGLHATYILDDGQSDEVKHLAAELGVNYIRRESNEGAKAGNINNALRLTEGEFFVILDADFVPKHNFLYEMLPFFEDESIAFVQSPQVYRNSNNIISKGAGYMQMVFYRLIMPGKNRFNAAFCVGTNVIFRRSAVLDVGGIYQDSKSEDIWTSILLHEKGYKSVYIPDTLAVGSTPDTIKAYSKQQLRWATGGFQIFFHHNPLSKNLSIDQKLQYLSTVTYYFHGIAIMLLFFLPPLHIFFNLTPVDLTIAFGA